MSLRDLLVGLFVFLAIAWQCYHAYLTWFRPERFRRIQSYWAQLYGEGAVEWVQSDGYLRYARAACALMVVVLLAVLLSSIFQAVSRLGSHELPLSKTPATERRTEQNLDSSHTLWVATCRRICTRRTRPHVRALFARSRGLAANNGCTHL